MGLTEIVRKVFLLDLLQGLKVTFKYQHPKEIYTEHCPLERPAGGGALPRRAAAERQP